MGLCLTHRQVWRPITYYVLMYEWDGRRIMYVRANRNCDHYDATRSPDFNGFDMDESMDIGRNWFDFWFTEPLPGQETSNSSWKLV